jgi:hypothetical protein
MPNIPGDDRRVGSTGYMMFSGYKDIGVGDFKVLTPPRDRDQGQADQPTNPTFIPIRGWVANVRRTTADVTSSVFYNAADDTVYSGSLPTGTSMEVRIEGVFRMLMIPPTVLAALYDGAAFTHVVLGFDSIFKFCEGNFLVTNFSAACVIDNAVAYTATLTNYGPYNAFPNELSGDPGVPPEDDF